MAIAGPWGAAVGAAVGGIWAAFKGKPDWAKIQSDIQKDFGVSVTQELAKQIEATAKTVKDRSTAIMMNLGAILKEAGGVTTSNLGEWTKKTADLFSFVERKQIDMKTATVQFNEVFPQLAKVVTETNGLASKSFIALIAQHDASQMKSKEVAAFVGQQLTAGISGLKAYVDNATITSQASATATGAAVAAMFKKLRDEGATTSDALKAIGPVVNTLAAQFAAAGLTGGAAFDQIKALSTTASDTIVSKAMTAVDGLNTLMKGLHNSGLMDQEMFTGLSAQITDTWNGLIAQGKDGDQVMQLMQPTLQTLWEMQNRFGYSVDEGTQKLLDQGVASGVVGSQYMSAQDRMAEATNRVAGAVEFMAQKMGYIPPAVDAMAGSMQNAAGRMQGDLGNTGNMIDNVGARARATPWEDWAARGNSAGAQARGAVYSVAPAFDTVSGQLDHSENAFEAWRRKAEDAANRVGDAVDRVSFGSSPGGLKEWVPMISKATNAFGDLKGHGIQSLRDMKRDIDSFSFGTLPALNSGGGMGGGFAAGGGAINVSVDARGAIFDQEQAVSNLAERVGEKLATKYFRGTKIGITG
jgi:uncharacterized protein YukE